MSKQKPTRLLNFRAPSMRGPSTLSWLPQADLHELDPAPCRSVGLKALVALCGKRAPLFLYHRSVSTMFFAMFFLLR